MPTPMADDLTPYAYAETRRPHHEHDHDPLLSWRHIKSALLTPTPSPVHLTYNSRSAKVPIAATPGEYTTIAQLLEDHVPSLLSHEATYQPVWCLPSGNMQTLYSCVGGRTVDVPNQFERKYILLPDGGNLALDLSPADNFDSPCRAQSPIVLVISGMLGGSNESQVQETVRELVKPKHLGGPGFRVCVMNLRGCSGSRITSPALYHAGQTDDVRCTILYLSSKFPETQLFGLGFSVGSGLLANYLGESGSESALSAGFCVSNVWDYRSMEKELNHGHNLTSSILHHVMGQGHRRLVANNKEAFTTFAYPRHTIFPPPQTPGGGPRKHPHADELKKAVDKLLSSTVVTMTSFTKDFLAPLAGYTDSYEFLKMTSSTQWILDVKVPLLCLNAADDPMNKQEFLPYDLIKESQHVVLAVTDKGGHASWFHQPEISSHDPSYSEADDNSEETLGLRRWYTKPIVEFFSGVHKTDPRPLPAPEATRPDSSGMVRSMLDPAVGFKECTEEDIMSLPLHGRRVRTRSYKSGSIRPTFIKAWVLALYAGILEVFSALAVSLRLVRGVVRVAIKSKPASRADAAKWRREQAAAADPCA